ncbi:hypothetical protein ACFVWG_29865 [Kribbella sp. NPDC058245]|uniref:DUF7878 domain-containing protein n=1 Tax=Kribbella sp. NPDC058245 TaxID=3346399 RepID=UPI0036EE335F
MPLPWVRIVLPAADGVPVKDILELAWRLMMWDREWDFVSDSMSYEEVGVLSISREEASWVFGPVFEPGGASTPVPWREVEACVTSYVEKVRLALRAAGLDPEMVFRVWDD